MEGCRTKSGFHQHQFNTVFVYVYFLIQNNDFPLNKTKHNKTYVKYRAPLYPNLSVEYELMKNYWSAGLKPDWDGPRVILVFK
jgi:hypothetical protein